MSGLGLRCTAMCCRLRACVAVLQLACCWHRCREPVASNPRLSARPLRYRPQVHARNPASGDHGCGAGACGRGLWLRVPVACAGGAGRRCTSVPSVRARPPSASLLSLAQPAPSPAPTHPQAFCTSLNWAGNLLVSATFPAMLAALGIAGARAPSRAAPVGQAGGLPAARSPRWPAPSRSSSAAAPCPCPLVEQHPRRQLLRVCGAQRRRRRLPGGAHGGDQGPAGGPHPSADGGRQRRKRCWRWRGARRRQPGAALGSAIGGAERGASVTVCAAG